MVSIGNNIEAHLPDGKSLTDKIRFSSYRISDDYIVFSSSSEKYYFDYQLNRLSKDVFDPVIDVFPTGHFRFIKEYKNGSGIKDKSGNLIAESVKDSFYSEGTGLLVIETYDNYIVLDQNGNTYKHFENYELIRDGGDYLCVYDGKNTYLKDSKGVTIMTYSGNAHFYTD